MLPTLPSFRWHCFRGVPRRLFILLAICQWRETTLFIHLSKEAVQFAHTYTMYIAEHCTYWGFHFKVHHHICVMPLKHIIALVCRSFFLSYSFQSHIVCIILFSAPVSWYLIFSFSSSPQQHPIVCTFSLFIFVLDVDTFFFSIANT